MVGSASGLTGFIAWVGIAISHYRFRRAYVAQGRAKLHQALIKDKRFDDKLFLLPAAQNTEEL